MDLGVQRTRAFLWHREERAGTTRDIAEVWPSATEVWGYAEEDQAASSLWGHGLGLAQYDDTPVVSRTYSLDHPWRSSRA